MKNVESNLKLILIELILGEHLFYVFLRSKFFIPNYIIDGVNRLTQRMIESGLQKFYKNYAKFLFTIKTMKQNSADAFRAIDMEQIQFCFIIYLSMISISIAVFILEIVHFKYRNANKKQKLIRNQMKMKNIIKWKKRTKPYKVLAKVKSQIGKTK